MNFSNLLYEQQGPVVRIWLNRPQQRNAQSQQLLQELDDAFGHAAKDESVRVVVLAGKGDHFSAGHDLKQAQSERANFTVEERWNYEERFYFDYCMRIFDFPKPTIAQVQGACVAGGFMISNMCDLIVAADDAYFSDPVGHTLATAATEVLIHPWVLGLRKAKEMLFAGTRLSAQDACDIGMVNRVVPRADLDEQTMVLAQRIATAAPFGMRILKRSLNRCVDMQGMRNSLQAHFDTHQLSHVTEEFKKVRDMGMANAIQKGKEGGQ